MAGTHKPDPEAIRLTEDIRKLVQRAEQGDLSVLPALRQVLDENPTLWRHYGDLAELAQLTWLNLACGSNLALRESISRRLEELRTELASENALPLEGLLVERVVVGWLQTSYADVHLAQVKNHGPDPARVRAATHLLDRAQQRYLAAIRQLAVVRKLLRPLPSPIEIASRLNGHAVRGRGGLLVGVAQDAVGVAN
jgi:hypothetical protein